MKRLTEKDILCEKGDYWAIKVNYGYDVYKNGITHSTRCARIGYKGKDGLDRVKKEIDRRIEKDNETN